MCKELLQDNSKYFKVLNIKKAATAVIQNIKGQFLVLFDTKWKISIPQKTNEARERSLESIKAKLDSLWIDWDEIRLERYWKIRINKDTQQFDTAVFKGYVNWRTQFWENIKFFDVHDLLSITLEEIQPGVLEAIYTAIQTHELPYTFPVTINTINWKYTDTHFKIAHMFLQNLWK